MAETTKRGFAMLNGASYWSVQWGNHCGNANLTLKQFSRHYSEEGVAACRRHLETSAPVLFFRYVVTSCSTPCLCRFASLLRWNLGGNTGLTSNNSAAFTFFCKRRYIACLFAPWCLKGLLAKKIKQCVRCEWASPATMINCCKAGKSITRDTPLWMIFWSWWQWWSSILDVQLYPWQILDSKKEKQDIKLPFKDIQGLPSSSTPMPILLCGHW